MINLRKALKKLLSVMFAGIMSITFNFSVVPVSAETIDTTNDLWIVEYLTGNKVIYQNDGLYVLDTGEIQDYAWGGIAMVYIIPEDAEDLTLEKLGLSDEYQLNRMVKDLPEGTKAYSIVVSSFEEADALCSDAVELIDAGTISNAYRLCEYCYGCNLNKSAGENEFILKLKDSSIEFDFSCIEGYENLEITQSETDASVYSIKYSDGFDYINIMEAHDTIVANENVERLTSELKICCAAHIVSEKKYVIEETDKNEENSELNIDYSMITIAGDVDLDNEQGISDIVTLTKYNTSPDLYPITDPTALANADMNKDGAVNTLDASILIEIALGTYESAF